MVAAFYEFLRGSLCDYAGPVRQEEQLLPTKGSLSTDHAPQLKKAANQKLRQSPSYETSTQLRKKQIARSKDKSQQIAVWRLLYWIQHLDQYSSRLQVILRPDIEPE